MRKQTWSVVSSCYFFKRQSQTYVRLFLFLFLLVFAFRGFACRRISCPDIGDLAIPLLSFFDRLTSNFASANLDTVVTGQTELQRTYFRAH
jgi:hypothetical protein